MNNNIILFGGGTNVRCCIDIIEKENIYKIAGITDPYKKIGDEIYDYKIIGRQEQIKDIVEKYQIDGGLITIGDNWTRKYVFDEIISIIPDFHFVSAIHPSAVVGKNVSFGKGVIVMAGCIINPGCRIGNFSFIVTGAQLDHDCIIGNFSSVSAASVTGGNVKISDFAAITLGVTVFDRVKIGYNSVIGSGSLVTKDIPDNVLAYGSPAQIIRTRKEGERFLKSGTVFV